MTREQQIEIEAAAFRGLVQHLQERTDVQNIDLMNLAGFCRNCLAKWYLAEALNQGLEMDYAGAQKQVYGMPIEQWKQEHQTPASDEQMADFEKTRPLHAKISGHN
jgi:uncharacterized protein